MIHMVREDQSSTAVCSQLTVLGLLADRASGVLLGLINL
jgi:hypothetical protein